MKNPLCFIIRHDFSHHGDGRALRSFLNATIGKVSGFLGCADVELCCQPIGETAGEKISIRIGDEATGQFNILYYYKDCWLVETNYDFHNYIRFTQTRSVIIKFASALGSREMWVYNDEKISFDGNLEDWLTAHKEKTAIFGKTVAYFDWDGCSLGEVIAANNELLHRYNIYYDPFGTIHAETRASKAEEKARMLRQSTGQLDVSAVDVGTITLRNGVVIPRFGYGIVSDTPLVTVTSAIEMGFRMLRTTGDCRSEAVAGRGIKESGIARNDVFVVSCLGGIDSRIAAAHQIDKLLESLGSDYIDLLIMSASPHQVAVYRAMEDALKDGKLRSLGVSGYAPQVGSRLQQYKMPDLENSVEIMPVVSEFEANFLTILPEVDRLRKTGTAVFAESPLSRWSDVNKFEVISAIATKYGVTNVQVALRYLYQLGILFAIATDKEWEMRQLMSVAGFSISNDDMKTISTMNLRQSYSDPVYIR